jgi:hypothetical protein
MSDWAVAALELHGFLTHCHPPPSLLPLLPPPLLLLLLLL